MSISEQNLEAKSMSIPEQNLEAPNQIGLKGQMPFDRHSESRDTKSNWIERTDAI